ncbi:Rad1-domain-containing protein [Didymella exigua CBS 183.55]|uniref:Rad1-domain-containing protein n=1 Tax=Didymella exigua CBS 183.55 TaxID=1150837 RepID=A0A6A5RIB5_9PLEO|nr:Rad1-domain-containing protein [Didymella exigua CBS 183.55]KAF1926176.1 Rad1-domain-containing protein [Didymella exigua CBS 183.55]
MHDEPPVLTAVSSAARQLFTLLRCIAFASKAHVTLSEDGLKFSVSEASLMEASAFLDKSLFTTFSFRAPPIPSPSADSDEEDATPPLTFHISLTALLETLQILGLTDPNTLRPPWARDSPYPTSTAFSHNVLGMNNLCRITYDAPGAPLSVILTEASIRTSCDLTTYEPEYTDDIPFDRQSLAFKTIMRGSWLYDAIVELSSTSPDSLTMYAKMVRGKPFFALSSTGTLGSARVEFNNQPPKSSFRATAANNHVDAPPANLLETFQLSDESTVLRQSYKYGYIQKAARAMSVASKVSVRVDTQGVLSMQFMIEVEPAAGGGTSKVSFVDFRFVPLVEEEDEAGDEGETFMQNGDEADGYDAF